MKRQLSILFLWCFVLSLFGAEEKHDALNAFVAPDWQQSQSLKAPTRAAQGKEKYEVVGCRNLFPAERIMSLSVFPDGDRLLVAAHAPDCQKVDCSCKKEVRLLNLNTETSQRLFTVNRFEGIACTSDTQFAVRYVENRGKRQESCIRYHELKTSDDGTIEGTNALRDMCIPESSGARVGSLKSLPRGVLLQFKAAKASRDLELMYPVDRVGCLKTNRRLKTKILTSFCSVPGIATSSDGEICVTDGDKISCFTINENNELSAKTFEEYQHQVRHVAMTRDEIASSSAGGVILRWNKKTYSDPHSDSIKAEIVGNHPNMIALDMFPDGTIVSAAEKTVRLWYSDKRKEQMAGRFAILNNQMIFPDDACVEV